jgi:hypothetical protein
MSTHQVDASLASWGLAMFKRKCTGGNCFAWSFTNERSGLEMLFVNEDADAEPDDPYWQLCMRGAGDHEFTESEHLPLADLAAGVINLCLQIDKPQSARAMKTEGEQ